MGDAPEQHAEAGQEPGKPKSKLPFIVAGLVIFLIIVGIIAFMVIGSGDETPVLKVATPEPPGVTIQFPQPFTTNLAPPDDQYMFSANIDLEMKPLGSSSDDEMRSELGMGATDSSKNFKSLVMQTIYEAINTKSRVQVSSQAGRDNLRTEIKRELNNFLQHGEVQNVFIYGVTVN